MWYNDMEGWAGGRVDQSGTPLFCHRQRGWIKTSPRLQGWGVTFSKVMRALQPYESF